MKCRPGAWRTPWRHRWGSELKQSASLLSSCVPHRLTSPGLGGQTPSRNCVIVCPSPSPAPQPEDCRRSFTQQPRRTTGKAWHPDYLRPAADKTMSAEELGSEGRWFGDDYERNGLFGNAPAQFGELREDFKPRSGEVASDLDQQFHPYQDDGRRPPVTMETASTGKLDIYGIKVPVQVISKSFVRCGLNFVSGFGQQKPSVLERFTTQRRSLVRLSQI